MRPAWPVTTRRRRSLSPLRARHRSNENFRDAATAAMPRRGLLTRSALCLAPAVMHAVPMPDPGSSLPPQVGRDDAWEQVTASFPCDQCGANACTLILLPPYTRDPHMSNPGTPLGLDTIFADSVRLSIDGPVKTTHTFLPAMNVDLSAVDAAVRARDVRALYAMDIEYVPFWCPSCSKNYCRSCWKVWVEYDESFYDCTRGRCPIGHERKMDD